MAYTIRVEKRRGGGVICSAPGLAPWFYSVAGLHSLAFAWAAERGMRPVCFRDEAELHARLWNRGALANVRVEFMFTRGALGELRGFDV